MVCKRLVCLVRIERIDGSRVSFVAGAPATTSAPEVGRLLDEEIEEKRERWWSFCVCSQKSVQDLKLRRNQY
jgi:hypothetical protein